jgi:phosphoglycolate phosphatase-like HAD superfamily hydrolase
MKSKPKIWFDCDGVLLDWTRPFLEHSGLVKHYGYEDLTDIDLSKLYADPSDFLKDMHSYHQSDMFRMLNPLVDIDDLYQLNKLGYELHIITQLEDDLLARLYRLENISRWFPDIFEYVHFTIRGESKWDYIMENHSDKDHLVVIEDNPAFLKEASDNRSSSDMIYAVRHPYNEIALANIPHVLKVNNVTEAIKHIIKWTSNVK